MKHKKHSKRNNPAKIKLAAIVPIITVLILLLAIFYAIFQQNTPEGRPPCNSCTENITASIPVNISNINQSDVKNATGLNYSVISSNKVTIPSPILKAQGFDYISISTFNYTEHIPQNATYPQTIVAIIYITKNSTIANQTMEGALLPAGIQTSPTSSNNSFSLNTTTSQNPTRQYYSYAGHTIPIYNSFVVAVLNESNIPYTYQAPIYQYTSSFTYNNVAGIVTIGGNIRMDPSISINLSKDLFRKLIKSSAVS